MARERTEAEVAKIVADAVEVDPGEASDEVLGPRITWPDAEKTPNSFCLQLEEDGPKYAVVVMRT